MPKGQESLKSPAWLNDKKYYHNQGDTTYEGENSIYGDFSGLDDIDTDSPEVVQGMIDIFKNVTSEFKPDGFRIDTIKHVNMAFWAEFAPALVNHAQELGIPEFVMFGEVYSGDSEELRSFTTEGKMQSVLDFSMQFALQDTLIKQQGTDKLVELFERDHYYNDSDSNANQLLNFTGNHDMGRFASMLKDSVLNYSEAAIIQRTLLAPRDGLLSTWCANCLLWRRTRFCWRCW
ncbi:MULTISPECIES: alpha-amylase family glycosyl hydrolase [unclassified Colwellia]|uniref:alpha-amylase family glycosyl hydrolase n=1 Tax=unclassified Colwellia TaxID=196834 RepID=UPI003855A4C1